MKQEVYASQIELCGGDIVKLLSTRRAFRHFRRNRKTRYRKARFLNRTRSKHKGWLAPSIEHKIVAHLRIVADIHKILLITKIVVETASFDIQKIKNPNIKGKEYQEGEQLGFCNVREYVLFRYGHECQCCHGKSKDKILETHYIESRKIGASSPNNLITLCDMSHTRHHNGTVRLPRIIKRGMRFHDATFMGIMRWAFYDKLKSI